MNRKRPFHDDMIKEIEIKKPKLQALHKQTYLFIYRREHTKYVHSDTQVDPSELEWRKVGEVTSIELPRLQNKQLPPSNIEECREIAQKYLSSYVPEIYQAEHSSHLSQNLLIEEHPPKKTPKATRADKKKAKIDALQRLLKDKFSLKAISEKLKINYSTVRRYVKQINHGDSFFRNVGRPLKVSKTQLNFIENLLTDQNHLLSKISQIQHCLQEEFGEIDGKACQETVRCAVKSLKFVKKQAIAVPVNRNSARVIDLRRKFVLESCFYLTQGKTPIYIDETSFQADLVHNYYYVRKGSERIHKTVVRTKNISTICAITNDSVIGYQSFKGGLTASDFAAFLTELLNNNLDIKSDLNAYIFITDNAAIHHAKIIKEFLQNLPILYLAPYSPFFNPIELLFSRWKYYFRSKDSRSLKEVLQNITRSFQNIPFSLLPKIFTHSLKFYPKGLDRIPI